MNKQTVVRTIRMKTVPVEAWLIVLAAPGICAAAATRRW